MENLTSAHGKYLARKSEKFLNSAKILISCWSVFQLLWQSLWAFSNKAILFESRQTGLSYGHEHAKQILGQKMEIWDISVWGPIDISDWVDSSLLNGDHLLISNHTIILTRPHIWYLVSSVFSRCLWQSLWAISNKAILIESRQTGLPYGHEQAIERYWYLVWSVFQLLWQSLWAFSNKGISNWIAANWSILWTWTRKAILGQKMEIWDISVWGPIDISDWADSSLLNGDHLLISNHTISQFRPVSPANWHAWEPILQSRWS